MKKRLEAVLAEFGAAALIVYLVIFGLTMAGFFVAISAGFAVEGALGSTGTLGAAWVATKLTQPLRIGATVVLTPLVAGLRRRLRPLRSPPAALADAGASTEAPAIGPADAAEPAEPADPAKESAGP